MIAIETMCFCIIVSFIHLMYKIMTLIFDLVNALEPK